MFNKSTGPTMKFKEFVILWSGDDGPLGDLCQDILEEKEFPFDKTEADIFKYLESEIQLPNALKSWKELKSIYLERRY